MYLLTCCATCWQVEYAALDALCLLMLLDNMIACAPPQQSTQNAPSLAETNTAQPSENDDQQACVDAAMASMSHHKLSSLDGAASDQSAAPLQQQTDARNISESSHDALHTASMSNRCAEAHLGTTDMRDSAIHKAPNAFKQSSGSTTEEAAAADRTGSALGPSADQTQDQKSAGLQTSHEAVIQQAVEHWACRLEMTPAGKAAKPKAKRHLSRRQRAHIKHAVEQQNQIDDVAGEHHVSICLACRDSGQLQAFLGHPKMPRQSLAWSTSFFSFGMTFNPIWLRHMALCNRSSCTQRSRQVCFICYALTCQNRVWHGNGRYLVNADGDVWQGLLCMCPGRSTLVSHASSVMS